MKPKTPILKINLSSIPNTAMHKELFSRPLHNNH